MNPTVLRLGCLALALATFCSIMQSDSVVWTNELADRETKIVQFQSSQRTNVVFSNPSQIDNFIEEQLKSDPIPLADKSKIDSIVGSVSASEWLGPLAPIAISPFFGIACLCGISQFGGNYLPLNSFISTNPVLNNPTVLWIFIGLTLVTSLPRLTKVSKPAAQAIDQLEAWAGIITLLIIRFAASASPEVAQIAEMSQDQFVQMGALSFTADTIMMIAAVINIFVINTVKFFYEVLVWLIPIPFVDALLEVANKGTCAGLMAIYAWNPMVATAINLLLFVACLLMFRWVTRQTGYMRAILLDPIRAKFSAAFGVPDKSQLIVFPNEQLGPFPSKTKLLLVPTPTGWQLQQHRMLMPKRTLDLLNDQSQLLIDRGLLVNKVVVTGENSGKLLFTRRYSDHLEDLGQRINIPVGTESSIDTGKMEISPA